MTYEEALKLFKDEDYWDEVSYRGGCFDTINDARKTAIEALEKVEQLEKENKELKEKQTPKKWKPATTEIGMTSGKKLKLPDHICPVCGYSLAVDAPYCECCGQAIDWSD